MGHESTYWYRHDGQRKLALQPVRGIPSAINLGPTINWETRFDRHVLHYQAPGEKKKHLIMRGENYSFMKKNEQATT